MSRDSITLTEHQRQLKDLFVEELGYWADPYDSVLRIDPDFFERYLALLARPHRSGHLDPAVREFMLIAVSSATTQLYNPGTRIHIGNAFDHGATFEEIREVLQRTSGLGVHSVTEGVGILVDVAGSPEASDDVNAVRDELREEFRQKRGYWSEVWERILQTDHEYFEEYLRLSSYPYQYGPLDPKVKEFLSIAYDSTTTNLFRPGLRGHIENALELGATREEIVEVLELASIAGFYTLTESAPILLEEAKKRDALPPELDSER